MHQTQPRPEQEILTRDIIPKIRRLKNIRRNTTELPNGTTVTAKTSLVDNLVAVVCRVNSFVPDTLVLMADGTTKPIEDVEIGDYVWATDPETGEAGPRRVVDTIIGGGTKELVDINIVGSTITATDQHPFWVDDRGRWIDAGDLHAGDVLLLADGSTVTVDGVGERVAVQRVHNLTVDGIHTYHVVVDDSAVLVHNECPLGLRITNDGYYKSTGALPSRDAVRALDPLDRTELAEVLELSTAGRMAELSAAKRMPNYSHLNRLAAEESLLDFIYSLPSS